MIALYTDWSALDNPWKWWRGFIAVDTTTWKSRTQKSWSAKHTTNNRMELEAVIQWLSWFITSHGYPEDRLKKLLWAWWAHDNMKKSSSMQNLSDNKKNLDQIPNEWLFAPSPLETPQEKNLDDLSDKLRSEPVIVYTDSNYVKLWITERIDTRVARQWRLSKWWWLVKNVDLWKHLYKLVQIVPQSQRKRVKAHVWNKRNEKVDQLARTAAIKQSN